MIDQVLCLDHGYVKVIETWGSEERIIEAARMSTDKGFVGWGQDAHDERCPNFGDKPSKKCEACGAEAGDEKLLAYLWHNQHATPFEMAGLIVEVQAPIFVFREWHRHRVFGINELSARYTPLPDVNYVPTVERLMINAGTSNKQAGTIKGSAELDAAGAQRFREALVLTYASQQALYEQALAMGVPKELARVHLPVGRYSRMRATANLRNWLGFLTLRMAPNAQWEIRMYANAVASFIEQAFPRTYTLFAAQRYP